jgi:hypothetical protein
VGGKVTLATGGSISTAIDTKLADEFGEGNEDNFLLGGSLLVIKDAAGAAAAPEGEFSRITGYTASTTTIAINPDLSAGVASGDRILFAPPDFPIYDVIEVVNDALVALGEIPYPDTSLTTAADTIQYTLPVALKGDQLLDAEVSTEVGGTEFVRIPTWSIAHTAPGTTTTITIPQYSESLTLRFTYLTPHPRVQAYDDFISEFLHPELVKSAAFAELLSWRNNQNALNGSADNNMLGLEEKARSILYQNRVLYMPSIPPRRLQSSCHW